MQYGRVSRMDLEEFKASTEIPFEITKVVVWVSTSYTYDFSNSKTS